MESISGVMLGSVLDFYNPFGGQEGGLQVKINLGFHEGAWILTSPRSSHLVDLRIFLILENDPEPDGSVLFSYELTSSHMDPFQTKFHASEQIKISSFIHLSFQISEK